MQREILVLDGPLTGRWVPESGWTMVVAIQGGPGLGAGGYVTVYVPATHVTYWLMRAYPTQGWRVSVPFYVLDPANSFGPGTKVPGGTLGEFPDAEIACRWCYGRPMDGKDYCSRRGCIVNVEWLRRLYGWEKA